MTNRPQVAGLRPSTNQNQPRNPPPADGEKPTILYQPLVHQFKCRGVLRLDEKTAVPVARRPNHDGADPLEALPSSLCRGIATRLQTVGSLPPARTPEEAEKMFRDAVVGGDIEEYERRDPNIRSRVRRICGGVGISSLTEDREGGSSEVDESLQKAGGRDGPEGSAAGGDTLSCYGTTNVSVLTVQEVPASAVSPLAMGGSALGAFFNPFSMIGGMGGMPPPPFPGEERRSDDGGSADDDPPSPTVDPWRDPFGDASSRDGDGGPPPGHPFAGGFGPFGPMLGGLAGGAGGGSYKSVSTTSSVVNGKRVTTTETTTVVDGQRKTVREITTVHPDGRREVVTEGDDGGGDNVTDNLSASDERRQKHPFHHRQAMHPFHQPPTAHPKVLAMMHDCRLGLELSDSLDDDKRSGVTETTLRVGNLGFTMRSDYDIVEDDGSFEDAQRGYSEKTMDAKDNDGRGEGRVSEDAISEPRTRRRESGGGKSLASPLEKGRRGEGAGKDPMYYLSRTAQSMERNAKALYEVVSESDFPDRVVEGGRKVAGNFGRTYERMEKLAGDMYRFWADDGDNGQSGGRGGGRW